jgi:glycosyltransferase involved in cell wall biosynthesis
MAEPKAERYADYDARRLQEAIQAVPRKLAAESRIAVLVPCFNEQRTIGRVVSDFRVALPSATIYVYDNNSTDDTALIADQAGATVRREVLHGKGNVVRRMFADIDADIYILVNGDGTNDAASAPEMIRRLTHDNLDMVNTARIVSADGSGSPRRSRDAVLSSFFAAIYGEKLTDIRSGYRALSRRFVKSFPALSHRFDIETEFTVHALELRLPIAEIGTSYRALPIGRANRFVTIRQMFRIVPTMLVLIREERPLLFFGIVAVFLAAISAGLAVPVFTDFISTGLVPRVPNAVLATGAMLLSFLSLASGLILDTVTRGRKEMKRLHYLAVRK